jgi:hypothetical protein
MAPQQKLRTHRSREAYCATLWWRWFVFFVFPCDGELMEWNWQGKTEVLRGKTCPNATLSTTNPTWSNPGSNPGLRGGRQTTNRLSHGTTVIAEVTASYTCLGVVIYELFLEGMYPANVAVFFASYFCQYSNYKNTLRMRTRAVWTVLAPSKVLGCCLHLTEAVIPSAEHTNYCFENSSIYIRQIAADKLDHY